MDRAPVFPVFAAGGALCTGARVLDCALAPVATTPAMIAAALAISHRRMRVVRATIRSALLALHAPATLVSRSANVCGSCA